MGFRPPVALWSSALVTLALIPAYVPSYSGTTEWFREDLPAGTFPPSGWGLHQQSNTKPARIRLVPAPGRPGQNALRFELHPTDTFAGFPRAEVIGPLDAQRNLRFFEYGLLYTIKTSYYLPPSYQIDPVQQELSFQVHHDCDGGSPPLAQVFTGGRIEWQVQAATALDYCGGDFDRRKLFRRAFDVGPIIRGKWVNLQITWRPAFDKTGILRVRMNDKLVVTHRGKTAYNVSNKHAGYLKEGIYKWCFKLPAPTCESEQPTPVKLRVVYYGPTLVTVR